MEKIKQSKVDEMFWEKSSDHKELCFHLEQFKMEMFTLFVSVELKNMYHNPTG